MSNLFTASVDDMVQELEREVALRLRVYPRWVEQKKMTQAKADWRIAVMRAAVEKLKETVS